MRHQVLLWSVLLASFVDRLEATFSYRRIFWSLRGGAWIDSGSDRDQDADDRPAPRRPRKRRKKQSSALTSVAKKSLSLTATAVSATARQSGKAAYYLVQPKHVDRQELVGLWRLDQWLDDEESYVTVELKEKGLALVDDCKVPWTFTPASWPKPAKIVVERTPSNNNDDDKKNAVVLVYKAVVHRKWADRSVLKLKGKIYARHATGWRGRGERLVQVGTFVGRRRLRLEDEEDESEDYDDEEEEGEFEQGDGEDDDIRDLRDDEGDGESEPSDDEGQDIMASCGESDNDEEEDWDDEYDESDGAEKEEV